MPKETDEERAARKAREKERAKEKEKSKETEDERAERKAREKERSKKDDKKGDREKDDRKSKKDDEKKDSKKDSKKDDKKSKDLKDVKDAMKAENEKVRSKEKEKDKEKEKEKDRKHKKGDDASRRPSRLPSDGDDQKKERRKSRAEEPKPQNKLVVDAEKVARQQHWDALMTRGKSLLRVLELDVVALECTACDIQPLTEYEMFITAYGGSDRAQASAQAPAPEDITHVHVQTDPIDMIPRSITMPDDFGLFVRGRAAVRAQRAAAKVAAQAAEGKEEEGLVLGKAGKAEREVRFETFDVDHQALGTFLQRSYPIFQALLDETVLTHADALAGSKKSKLAFSAAFTSFSLEAIVGDRPVTKVVFSSLNPQYLVALYGPAPMQGTPGTSRPETKEEMDVAFLDGLMVLWNVNSPHWPDRFLVSTCQITAASFSASRPHLVYGAGAEGQVMAWDLREPDHMHTVSLRSSVGLQKDRKKKKKKKDDDDDKKDKEKGFLVLRFPTYTSQYAHTEVHPFPVVSLKTSAAGASYVKSKKKKDAAAAAASMEEDEENEQLATLDAGGVLSMWVVQELQGGENSIAERDMGLAPYARVKLLRSSALEVRNPDKFTGRTFDTKESVASPTAAAPTQAQRTFEMTTGSEGYIRQIGTGDVEFVPRDVSRYLVGTDTGFVIHASRFNSLVQPPLYYSTNPNPCLNMRERATLMAVPRDLKYGTTALSIAFCPSDPDFFLAGFSDGSVSIYRDGEVSPVYTYSSITHRQIVKVAWSHSWKGVFFAMSDGDEPTLYVFDLMNDEIEKRLDYLNASILLRKGAKEGEVNFPVSFDVSWDMKGDSRIAIAYKGGNVDVHVLKDSLFNQQQRNQDFFTTLDL
eukprot:TRINITY_DN434_c2_g4_i2.p1 TRINITY_DN434_c2_g4~~TRINITY_DN434_c2_g4_i2.p1  ORF type:complete len:867 (-),score=247.04 TRINITY_DN434_c2_g4_i2:792-3392(-)